MIFVVRVGVPTLVYGNPARTVSIGERGGCVWEVWHRFMHECTQVAEKEHSMSGDEGDEVSSYGTGHSSDERMEATRDAVAASGDGDLGTLFAAIATFSRGQSILIEKLTLLEKVVGTVQFDMTWVRDDMKAVHQVMERIAGNVCDLREGVPKVDMPREQVSVHAYPPRVWKGKEQETYIAKPPSASTSRGDPHCGDDGLAGGSVENIDIVHDDDETQDLIRIGDVQFKNIAATGDARRDWGYAREASPPLRLTQWPQTRVIIEMEPLQEESQQIEMSCQSAQLPTPAADRSMWSDFTAAVRDWPAPTEPAAALQEGWVRSKKGNWDITDYGKGLPETGNAPEAEEHVQVNLNFVPERLAGTATTWGEGAMAPTDGILEASKKGPNGMGRGAGRGRGLPAVQPRFHTPVRVSCP